MSAHPIVQVKTGEFNYGYKPASTFAPARIRDEEDVGDKVVLRDGLDQGAWCSNDGVTGENDGMARILLLQGMQPGVANGVGLTIPVQITRKLTS